MDTQTKDKQALRHKIFTIVGIVLCAILLPLLIMNIIMIINSYRHKDQAPSIGKNIPFIVKSNSMSGTIEGGDIIITKRVDTNEIVVNDIIAFYDPKGSGTSVVTHRVIKIEVVDGKRVFTTVGDVIYNQNILKYGSAEAIPENVIQGISEVVPQDKVISKYSFRIPWLGSVSLFMSTIPGFIVCVLLPLLLLIGYDIIRRRINDKATEQDTQALLAELEMLRSEKEESKKTETEEKTDTEEVFETENNE